MKFLKLILDYEDAIREIEFSPTVNLIVSKKNSVGKSTLLRLLFYSLGYAIPSTKGINFSKVKCELIVDNFGKRLVLKRKDDLLTLVLKNEELSFTLPDELEALHAIIFQSPNHAVTANILGAIYLDQEKGWTLLNQGVVIGRIRFDLKELVGGLAERMYEELRSELNLVSSELKKYKTMESLYEYQTTLMDLKNETSSDDYIDELERDHNVLLIEKNSLTKQIKDMEQSIRDNAAFVRYIESMRLYIKDDGKEILITRENLANFEDSQNIIKTRKKILELKRSKIEAKLKKLNQQIIQETELISIQTEIQKFDSQISELIINPLSLNRIINQLKQREKELKKSIKNVIVSNNAIIDDMYFTIRNYAEELGVIEYMDDNKDYIFTNDLKSLSGAVYHKIVFIFKVAYIKEIQKYLKTTLPIVLDSPSGREVDQENIADIMRILNRDFSANQIIIASIFSNYSFDEIKKIEIKDRIFELSQPLATNDI
ncbi:hypothetical protein [Enterococcus innesii]|uniref:hypothetical protein n=1 Tax=Enterococcus innesii TaxID=2839759 RepID=UPI003D0FAD58